MFNYFDIYYLIINLDKQYFIIFKTFDCFFIIYFVTKFNLIDSFFLFLNFNWNLKNIIFFNELKYLLNFKIGDYSSQ
jgi:hypothetical protein